MKSYFSPPEIPGGHHQILWLPSQRPSLVPERLAEWHNHTGSSPHLIWCASTGAVVEMIHPGYKNALFSPLAALSGMYAVEVVCEGGEPFTDSEHLAALLERLEPLSVPADWPLGPPEGYARWKRSFSDPGHYASEQVTTRLGAVGPIDINRIRRNP
jgi:hypothetical protein